MANVLDVAAYILDKLGPMTAMKLQKLAYYSQAWALVWDDEPLFTDRIQAWANGPVSPLLHFHHRGMFTVARSNIPGDPEQLDAEQRGTIDIVLNFYGPKEPQWLSELTHKERPWVEARAGIPPGERGDREITHAAMAEYYGSL